MTRGIANNNPGNIRISDAHWLGKITPSQDPDFEQFDTPEHGIRALAKTLLAYFDNHNLGTVREIISRWAPPEENNTAAYVAAVSDQTGFDPDESLDLTESDTMSGLCKAIIHQENGNCPYTPEQMASAVSQAYS